MIFTPEHCRAILEGRKTKTRRVRKEGESEASIPVHTVFHQARERDELLLRWPKWSVGNTYAIQPGRGKKSVGRILITGIRREKLQDISKEDITAEGYPLIEFEDEHEQAIAFAEIWDSINKPPHDWASNCDVWVLEFKLEEKYETL